MMDAHHSARNHKAFVTVLQTVIDARQVPAMDGLVMLPRFDAHDAIPAAVSNRPNALRWMGLNVVQKVLNAAVISAASSGLLRLHSVQVRLSSFVRSKMSIRRVVS